MERRRRHGLDDVRPPPPPLFARRAACCCMHILKQSIMYMKEAIEKSAVFFLWWGGEAGGLGKSSWPNTLPVFRSPAGAKHEQTFAVPRFECAYMCAFPFSFLSFFLSVSEKNDMGVDVVDRRMCVDVRNQIMATCVSLSLRLLPFVLLDDNPCVMVNRACT